MRLTIYNLRRRKYLEPYNITKLQNVYVYLFVLRIGLIRVLNHTVQSPKCLIHLYIDDLYICISMIYTSVYRWFMYFTFDLYTQWYLLSQIMLYRWKPHYVLQELILNSFLWNWLETTKTNIRARNFVCEL
jgi:hypothetical protein